MNHQPMVTYKRKGDKSNIRFNQYANDPLPPWADDVQPRIHFTTEVDILVRVRIEHYADEGEPCDLAVQAKDEIDRVVRSNVDFPSRICSVILQFWKNIT